MKYKSIWETSLEKHSSKKLEKDIDCDVLIIGGGITGLTTAFYLRNSNQKVVLVERNKIGSGASSKSTGKINYLQDILYKIARNKVDKYLTSQIDAIKLVKEIITDNKIDCDLKRVSSYLFGNTNREIEKINKIEQILKNNKLSYKREKLPIDIENKYAIKVTDTYDFNPGLYINGLKNTLDKNIIYENTFINKIEKADGFYIAYSEGIKIKAKIVVLACWYPFFIKPFFFPIKASLEKSYLGAFKTKKNKSISGINLGKKVKSFRYYKNYLIYLMNSHLICNGNNDKLFNNLINALSVKPDYLWSNIDIMSNDSLPFIGEINENLLIGTGYNTWGNTSATLAGKVLSDIILNRENEYKSLFDPKRSTNIKKIGNNIINSFCSIKGYIKGLLTKNKNVYYFNDRAIYVSSSGKHYPVKRKCPHMKCNLIFNNKEKTWDCPCHASRFDINGKCIFGPSNYDIKLK